MKEVARAKSRDQALTARVRAALTAVVELRPRPIHIATVRRSVRLFGAVVSDTERLRAGAAVRAVAGVDAVINALAVRAPRRTP